MSNSTAIQKRETSIAEGSIFDLAARRNKKPEEIVANADVVVLLDCSSSMLTRLDGSWSYGRAEETSGTRYSEAVKALEMIQQQYQGKVLLITFASGAGVQYGGLPPRPEGTTNLRAALELAHTFDDMGMKFIVVSDGQPDRPDDCIVWRDKFKSALDTIFIGRDGDSGLTFMNKLATGTAMGRVEPKLLGTSIKGLLESR